MQLNTRNTFLIINKKVQYALQNSSDTHKKEDEVEVGPVNPNNKRQLWILQEQEGQSFEIINGFTDSVLTEDAPNLILKRGNANRHQLWKFQFINGNELRIRRAKGDGQFLMLEGGRVKVAKVNATKADTWLFQPVQDATILNKSCFIIASDSKHYLDIPEASHQQGEKIGLWKPNFRYNQRWKILRAGEVYVIKSFFNQLNLDIEDEQYESGTKIVQYASNGNVSQFWKFQRINPGRNEFRISTCFDPTLHLGHHHNKLILNKDNKFTWLIDGYFPQ